MSTTKQDFINKLLPKKEFAAPLNTDIELAVKANCFLVTLMPKPGLLIFGNRGVEFRAKSGNGFVQIPWNNIVLVDCDIYGTYVRNISFHTDDNKKIPFVISKGKDVLLILKKHLGQKRLKGAEHSFQKAGKGYKSFFAKLFSRFHKS